jgi:hypothetical protein
VFGCRDDPLGRARSISSDLLPDSPSTKIKARAGMQWLQAHLDYCVRPLLDEPWVLDVDATIKLLHGHQEGAVVGYNPRQTRAAIALLSHLHALGSALGAAG